MTAVRRLALVGLAGGLFGSPAWGLSGIVAAPQEATSVAAFAEVAPAAAAAPLPVGTAAFPDVEPPKPSPPADPAEALLLENPYASALAAAVQAERAADEEASPYEKLVRGLGSSANAPLANPYVDELRRLTTEVSDPENPYASMVRR